MEIVAVDYAKQNKHEKIVEYLTKGITQIITPTNHTENNVLTPAQTLKQKSEGANPISQLNEEEKIQQLESNNKQLTEKIQQLESNNKQLTDKIKQLESNNKQLTDKIKQLESNNEQSTEKIRQFESNNEQSTKKIRELESSNEQLTGENSQLKSYLSALKEKISDIKFINFDDYEEESEIDNGATSSVKIVAKKLPEKFAKKELKEFDFKTFQRFLFEAEILFKLRHPCIIRIYGVNYGNKDHSPLILLSLEPFSLEKAINEKTLTKEQKNRITVEIVLGMRYIHHRNFMHRDLKPLNILLSKNLHVRITDFGLAKEEDMTVSQSKGVGTMRFMAPELFEENDDDDEIPYTNKVDVYSFGITLIFIVCDTYPKFNMKNILNRVRPTLPESIIGWTRELIIRCLSPSPDERPSFAEIFEIMKSNNFDLFNEKNSKLTSNLKAMKNEIEKRILKIEAFEYQHRND